MSTANCVGFQHPLPKGTRILSVLGECDRDGDDNERVTGPNAIGEVTDANHRTGQGWSYDVVFQGSGVWVILDEHGELDDAARYKPG